MDELKEVWKNWEFKEESTSPAKTINEQDSNGLIEKLRRKVQWKFYYAVAFTAVFTISLPFIFPLASQILFTILNVAYLIGSILLFQELKILKAGVDMSQNMLTGLITYKNRIRRVLHYEELVGLCLYPVSGSAGFFLGMQAVDREAEIMNSSRDWAWFIATMVVLTLAGHWLARWMNRKAFGKYLDQLDRNIKELMN